MQSLAVPPLESATVVEWEAAGLCSRRLYSVPPLCSQDGTSLLRGHTTRRTVTVSDSCKLNIIVQTYFCISYLPHMSNNRCISPRVFSIYAHFTIWIRDQSERLVKPPERDGRTQCYERWIKKHFLTILHLK